LLRPPSWAPWVARQPPWSQGGGRNHPQWWFKPVPTTRSGSVAYNIKFIQPLSTPTSCSGFVCVRVRLSSPMAIDLIGVSKMDDKTAIQEVASAGLNSMEHLIYVLSHQASPQSLNCREITDFTISKFKRVISILSRTSTPGSTAKPCPPGDIVTTSNCSKPPP
jgi:hypothetical protein